MKEEYHKKDPDTLIFIMVPDGFSALQLVSPEPAVLAEIKMTILYKTYCPFIIRFEFSHNAI